MPQDMGGKKTGAGSQRSEEEMNVGWIERDAASMAHLLDMDALEPGHPKVHVLLSASCDNEVRTSITNRPIMAMKTCVAK